jgi:hypothetical protein
VVVAGDNPDVPIGDREGCSQGFSDPGEVAISPAVDMKLETRNRPRPSVANTTRA